jgi:pimeloyl-ACP methyl ester carboxylesterase
MRGPRAQTVAVEGLSFRVFSTSAPRPAEAPSFVLIHGIGTSHRYLAELHRGLSAGADVHSIDMPGFGGVAKPGSNPDIRAMAGALSAVLDGLDVRRAVVVGHSMGVQWAVELAALRSDLVAAVVLIGPVTDSAHRSLLAQAVALGRDTLGETPVVNAIVFADYLRCGPRWFLKQSRYMIDYPIENRVRRLRMPVLVIRGGNDPIAGTDWCRRLTRAAELGRFVVVPGHRHVVQHTAPRAVASAIRAFLRRP